MSEIELPQPLSDILNLLPSPMVAEVRSAFTLLQIKGAQLAVESAAAEIEGLAFSDAVHRPADYPLMSKIHRGMEAFLLYELKAEHAEAMRAFFKRLDRSPRLLGEARAMIFDLARATNNAWAAAARFLAYEAGRLNLLVRTWDAPQVEAIGVLRDFDVEAERVMRKQLAEISGDVRPLEVLVSELMIRLTRAYRKRAAEIDAVVSEIRDEVRHRTQWVTFARNMTPAKNLIIKNALVPTADRLASAELVELFPELFSSANQVDAARRRLSLKDANAERNTRVLDLLREEG